MCIIIITFFLPTYFLYLSSFGALVFAVQVIAIDEDEPSFISTATVTIHIRDDNDNSPKFPQETYRLDVPENSPTGTELQVITVGTLLAQCKHLLNSDTLFSVTNEKHYFLSRQLTLTLWIKTKLSTNSFQPTCVSTLPDNTNADIFS